MRSLHQETGSRTESCVTPFPHGDFGVSALHSPSLCATRTAGKKILCTRGWEKGDEILGSLGLQVLPGTICGAYPDLSPQSAFTITHPGLRVFPCWWKWVLEEILACTPLTPSLLPTGGGPRCSRGLLSSTRDEGAAGSGSSKPLDNRPPQSDLPALSPSSGGTAKAKASPHHATFV